jgi:HK97 family phage major capsid protein
MQRAPKAHMRPIPADGEARGDGLDYEGEEASVSLKPEERFADWAARSGGSRGGSELRGLTTGGLLKAMVLGPKTEAERRALSGGSDSAGGFTVPDVLSSSMIDRMRRQSVVIRAGARTIPLTSDVNNIAKVLTDPVPAWRAENAEITNSDATFGRVQMLPKSLAVLCRVSRELLEDSLNIDTVLPDIIAKAMAAEVDRMCLFGSGSGAEPTGVTLMAGINEVSLDGALSSHANGFYGSLIEGRRLLLDANSGQPSAFVMNPREDETLIAALTGDGYPMPAPPKIAAIPQLVTTAVPKNGGTGTNESSIVFGDFARMMLGVRNSLRIEVLKERYADYHQYAFIAHLRATVAVEHVLAFGHVTGITPET